MLFWVLLVMHLPQLIDSCYKLQRLISTGERLVAKCCNCHFLYFRGLHCICRNLTLMACYEYKRIPHYRNKIHTSLIFFSNPRIMRSKSFSKLAAADSISSIKCGSMGTEKLTMWGFLPVRTLTRRSAASV